MFTCSMTLQPHCGHHWPLAQIVKSLSARCVLAFSMRILILAAMLFCASAKSHAETLAVLPMQNLGDRSVEHLAPVVFEGLTEALAKTRRFALVERNQLSSVIAELKLQNSGIVDEQTAAAIGLQSGAKLVMLGSFSGMTTRELQDTYNQQGQKNGVQQFFRTQIGLNLRLVDVQTGVVVTTLQVKGGAFSGDVSASQKGGIDDLQVKLAREFSNAFPLAGYIIKANSNDEFTTDLGANAGVAVNDAFTIYAEGEDIIHPVTGKVIKGEKKIVGEGVVTSVQNDISVIKVSSKNAPIIVGQTRLESKPKTKGLWESFKDIGVHGF